MRGKQQQLGANPAIMQSINLQSAAGKQNQRNANQPITSHNATLRYAEFSTVRRFRQAAHQAAG
jgi:hypothetical protein